MQHLFNATMVNIGMKICESKVSIDAIHGSGAKVNYPALDSTDYEWGAAELRLHGPGLLPVLPSDSLLFRLCFCYFLLSVGLTQVVR